MSADKIKGPESPQYIYKHVQFNSVSILWLFDCVCLHTAPTTRLRFWKPCISTHTLSKCTKKILRTKYVSSMCDRNMSRIQSVSAHACTNLCMHICMHVPDPTGNDFFVSCVCVRVCVCINISITC